MKRFWHVVAKPIRLMLFDNHNELRWRLINMENTIMDAIDDLKVEFDGLKKDVEAFIMLSANRETEFQARLDAAIANAHKDDELTVTVAMNALQDEVKALRDELPVPVFTPSGNGG